MIPPILPFFRKIFPWWVRHYHRLEVRGIEHIPRYGSAIIAGNHSGGWDLDNFCCMSALEQSKLKSPARQRIWELYWDKWAVDAPVFSQWVQQFSPVPLSLTGKGLPYHLIDKIVDRGELLAIMPEGHSASIKEGYRLWKFYPGVIRLHLHYHIPIIPTANLGFVFAAPILGSDYDETEVPPWVNEKYCPFIFPVKLIIQYGHPLQFSEYYDQELTTSDYYRLANILRSKVANLIRTVQREEFEKKYAKKRLMST